MLAVRGDTMGYLCVEALRRQICMFSRSLSPRLARNYVLSILVPVVGINAKGIRNLVLSYFVPIVGIEVKGTMMSYGS